MNLVLRIVGVSIFTNIRQNFVDGYLHIRNDLRSKTMVFSKLVEQSYHARELATPVGDSDFDHA
jgi:hypothetical protein